MRGLVPFNRVLAKPWGYGRFSSPLRNSKTVSFYHSSGDTPSVSLSLDSSLREGAGRGGRHSSCRPETGRLRAIFIAPTKLRMFNRSHSSGDTPSVTPVGRDSSLREGAGNDGAVPFNVPLGNREVAGDFHRPYGGRVGFIVLLKSLRFLTQKRYRVGQGTHVWEPARCVTKKTLRRWGPQG